MNNRWMTRLIISGLVFLNVYIVMNLWEPVQRIWSLVTMVMWPFVLAWLLHYALYPVTQVIRIRGVSQAWATVIVYISAAISCSVLVVNGLPKLIRQWDAWKQELPGWTVRAHQLVEEWKEQPDVPYVIQRGLDQAVTQAELWVSNWVSEGIAHLPETANGFLLLFVVPFLLFYFLKENGQWVTRMRLWVPKSWQQPVGDWLHELDEAIGDFVRGQLIVCVAVGIVSYVGFRLLGMPNALLLAVFTAVMNIIPYLGPLISMVPAWLSASAISWQLIISVTFLSLVIQLIEGYVLAPWIVGRAVEAHPLMILLALIAGAEWGGVWGLVLSVPILIGLKITWKHAIVWRKRLKQQPQSFG